MADGIPYPQAPQYNVPNPLQEMQQMQSMGLHAAETQRVQQTAQQQLLENKAKMALGQIMQHSLDPATGEPDMHKVLAGAAQNRDTAVIYPTLFKDALQMGLVDAQRHNAQLESNAKHLEFASKAFAGLANKPDITDGDVSGALAQIAGAASLGGKWSTEQYLNYKQRVAAGMSPRQFVANALGSSDQGLKALQNAQEMMKYYAEPISIINQDPNSEFYGQKESIPRSELLRRQSQRGMPVGGGLAPPAAMGREGEQPLAPPSALSISPEFSEAQKEAIKSKGEAYSKKRDDITEGVLAANESSTQIVNMLGKLEGMGYRTGTFAPEQLAAAKLALYFAPNSETAENLLTSIMNAKSPQEAANIVGVMEGFDKQGLLRRTQTLRNAIGTSNKLTNMEFSAFNDALEGLRTSPQGIVEIYKYIEKMNELARLRGISLRQFEDDHGHTIRGRDGLEFEKMWGEMLQQHPELYKYEGPRAEEEKK